MKKIKKGLNFRIVTLLISICFFFDSSAYGIDTQDTSGLRVPLSSITVERIKKTEDRVSGKQTKGDSGIRGVIDALFAKHDIVTDWDTFLKGLSEYVDTIDTFDWSIVEAHGGKQIDLKEAIDDIRKELGALSPESRLLALKHLKIRKLLLQYNTLKKIGLYVFGASRVYRIYQLNRDLPDIIKEMKSGKVRFFEKNHLKAFFARYGSDDPTAAFKAGGYAKLLYKNTSLLTIAPIYFFSLRKKYKRMTIEAISIISRVDPDEFSRLRRHTSCIAFILTPRRLTGRTDIDKEKFETVSMDTYLASAEMPGVSMFDPDKIKSERALFLASGLIHENAHHEFGQIPEYNLIKNTDFRFSASDRSPISRSDKPIFYINEVNAYLRDMFFISKAFEYRRYREVVELLEGCKNTWIPHVEKTLRILGSHPKILTEEGMKLVQYYKDSVAQLKEKIELQLKKIQVDEMCRSAKCNRESI